MTHFSKATEECLLDRRNNLHYVVSFSLEDNSGTMAVPIISFPTRSIHGRLCFFFWDRTESTLYDFGDFGI